MSYDKLYHVEVLYCVDWKIEYHSYYKKSKEAFSESDFLAQEWNIGGHIALCTAAARKKASPIIITYFYYIVK